MNKHHLASAKRALLERWLGLLEDAQTRQEGESEARRIAANGQPFDPPPLLIPAPSQDMKQLLMEGIQAALDGKPDPFGIAAPTKGNKPKYNRQGWLDVVREIFGEIERNKNRVLPYGKRDPVTEAINTIAERHGLSAEAIWKAYKDPDNAIAKLQGPLYECPHKDDN